VASGVHLGHVRGHIGPTEESGRLGWHPLIQDTVTLPAGQTAVAMWHLGPPWRRHSREGEVVGSYKVFGGGGSALLSGMTAMVVSRRFPWNPSAAMVVDGVCVL
jgi:hypothetical protein